MTVVAVAAIFAAALIAVALTVSRRESASAARAHARREDLLVNQLLHLAGRTWSPPPVSGNSTPAEPVALSYTVHPEGFDWSDTDA